MNFRVSFDVNLLQNLCRRRHYQSVLLMKNADAPLVVCYDSIDVELCVDVAGVNVLGRVARVRYNQDRRRRTRQTLLSHLASCLVLPCNQITCKTVKWLNVKNVVLAILWP